MKAWKALMKAGCNAFDKVASDGVIRQRVVTLGSVDRSVEVSLAYRGDGKYIDGKAFTLHRWLFAQFVRKNWIELIPRTEVERLEQTAGKWRIKEMHDREFDEVYFGVPKRSGSEIEKENSPISWTKKFRKSLETRGLHRGYGWVPSTGRLEPEIEKPGLRRFFSDLFDSSTQTEVLETLKRIDEKSAEERLVQLYKDRLFLEIRRRDQVVVNDDQLIEGAFFLRWIPSASEDEWGLLKSGRFVTRRRKLDGKVLTWSEVAANLYSKLRQDTGGQDIGYESNAGMVFSAIEDLDARKDVSQCLTALKNENLVFNTLDALRDAVEAKLKEKNRPEWRKLHTRHKALVEAIDGNCIVTEDYESSLNFLRNNEDLAAFAVSGVENIPELKRIFYSKFPAQRSPKYEHFKELLGTDSELANGIKHFYDRAVLRAFADQHGATVFETIRMEQLPVYTDSQRDSRPPTKASVCRRKELTPKTLIGLEPSDARVLWQMERREDCFHYEHWRSTQPVGCAALDVLIGCSLIERHWVEEAQTEGPRAPAVIDEEKLGEKTICRVEYRDEIGPGDEKIEKNNVAMNR